MPLDMFLEGQTVRIRTTTPFRNAAGVATDPTTVTLRVETPTVPETVYTYAAAQVQRVAAGDYYKDIQLTEPGIWVYRWEGTGAVEAVDEDVFHVRPSDF